MEENHNKNKGVAANCSSDDDVEKYVNSLPVGFRFAPHDDELILHYLLKKIKKLPLPRNRIHEVDLYKYSPRKLTEIYKLNRARETEWYFFTAREKKYSNGSRPNRSAGDGFWKPTGTDKAIPNNKNPVGFRKSLDYYSGKQGEGRKTDWKMHEYLVNPKLVSSTTTSRPKNPLQPMLLDEWVLCKIYATKAERKKNNNDEDGGTTINSKTEISKADDSTAQPSEYDNSLMIFEENENGFGSYYPPPLTLNNFVYDPPTMNNTLNYNFNYDPPPVNNTFSDSFVYNVPPIQSYLPSSYSYDFQPIYGCPDQVCYSDCMEMPTINNNQSMPTEESIPSFPTIQSIYGYGDQVCYSDCMEMPTINNNQSMPTEESIPSFPTIQSIYGYGDEVCYSDCMEMPTMNNHQSEEPIPSLQPVHPIHGFGDQVCYSDCMEVPTMNNHQSVPSEEPIPSVQPAAEKNNFLGAQPNSSRSAYSYWRVS
ncbi:hypothetical protein P3X46_013560 [Hevea brasiliensis]|uniref:NAC domain-containing protein n=1 Tax=Hevea brasiliensis TaxID=3981 RepID=A0ABQ9M7U5_HEVBR|nr:hypothetical protein P3X46_013560 [Hevea brasiliensis]